MSSRRNGSVSRAAETASKTRLHMDRNPQHSRMTDPSNPAGRRKELDNVMKRARQASPGSWDRKLLEVEEKDPNRWRHTGYKQMYLEGSGSVSPRRSRSRSPLSSRRTRSPPPLGRRSRSPVARRVRSPVARRSPRKSRSPRRSPRRSPVRRAPSPVRRRSPRARSPLPRARSPIPRPRSPVRARSPVARARSPVARARSPVARARSPVARRATPPPRSRAMAVRPRPPSPPPRKSSSGSSGSSCSDESCSVCSAKNKKGPPPPPPKGAKIPPRLKSSSPNRARAIAGVSGSGARAVQPTRELLKAREGSKRTREEKVLEWQRGQLLGGAARSGPVPIPPEQIKREGERAPPPTDPRPRPHPPPHPHPRVSPAAINAALTRRSESDSDTASSEQKPHRLTLSERFGKMAQWSMDRSARLENMNMRITRRDAQLHVRIDAQPDADAKRHPALMEIDGPGAGSYPEELLSAAPGGLPSWDDVTVRYDYYKKKGYLRGLTLGDYVKWEEWWYKYQEWLERERAYERWAEGESRPNRRDGRRRKGGGRHRRS